MTIAPLTLAPALIEELNNLRQGGKYLEKASFAWQQLKRKAEQVIIAEPASGWAVMGMVQAIAGDIDECDRCFQNSLRLKADISVSRNLLASYATLGFFTKAVELYSEIGSAETSVFTSALEFGLTRGAFQTAKHYIQAARKLEFDMTEIPVALVERSAAVLERAGLSDLDVARHLEAAGSVLRERRVFEVRQPEIIATDVENVFTGVTMVLYISCDPSEIFSYNVALAEKEDEMNLLKNPAFDVVFSAIQ